MVRPKWFSNILNDYSLYFRLHTSVFQTFPPQTIAFSPPFSSTRRLLHGMAASAASSPGANLKVGDLRAALMDSAVIGYNCALKREAWREHPPSLPPCQRRRKRICQRKIGCYPEFYKPFLAVFLGKHPKIPNLSRSIFFVPKFSMASALMKEDNWTTKNLEKAENTSSKQTLKKSQEKIVSWISSISKEKRWRLVHLPLIFRSKNINNAHENVNVDMSLAQGRIL